VAVMVGARRPLPDEQDAGGGEGRDDDARVQEVGHRRLRPDLRDERGRGPGGGRGDELREPQGREPGGDDGEEGPAESLGAAVRDGPSDRLGVESDRPADEREEREPEEVDAPEEEPGERGLQADREPDAARVGEPSDRTRRPRSEPAGAARSASAIAGTAASAATSRTRNWTRSSGGECPGRTSPGSLAATGSARRAIVAATCHRRPGDCIVTSPVADALRGDTVRRHGSRLAGRARTPRTSSPRVPRASPSPRPLVPSSPRPTVSPSPPASRSTVRPSHRPTVLLRFTPGAQRLTRGDGNHRP
jgi:hypothetical protein